MTPSPPRGRARELSPEQVEEMRADLRFLLQEGGWTHRGLNGALGFPAASGMLRNILYDKSGKASTTRARFDAVKRIREEQLTPGVVLIEAAPPKAVKRSAKAAVAGKTGRGAARRREPLDLNAPFADDEPTARTETAAPPRDASSDTAALRFHMNETDFTARQNLDGQWQVTFTAVCSTEQMISWTRQVVSDYLLPSAAALTPEPTEAGE